MYTGKNYLQHKCTVNSNLIMVKKWEHPTDTPFPARPFVIVSFDDSNLYLQARKELSSLFGKIDYESPTVNSLPIQSLYGLPPRQQLRLLSFSQMVSREELVDLRKRTMELERKLVSQGQLPVELDPGYLTEYTIIRTTLEDSYHCIYLFHNIYAECIYLFEKLSFQPTTPCPPYLRHHEVITFFQDLRVLYVSQLKKV